MNKISLEDWLRRIEGLHPKPIDLGLQRISQVWQQLHPDSYKPFVISVAGTNGKGSVVAFLERILLGAGYRVGAYTSPHLVRYNERIHINGKEATDKQIINSFELIDQARDAISLSYFEYTTLAAIWLFAKHHLDVALLEVGLGGRLDAINILDADAVILSSIGYDHQHYLGKTLDLIGSEKAGILRANQPAVFAQLNAPKGFVKAAEQSKAAVYYAGKDYNYHVFDDHWVWSMEGIDKRFRLPNLQGRHQIENAAGVVTLLHVLSGQLTISHKQIDQGIATVEFAGRIQKIASEPDIIVDVAHNAESAQALAEYLADREEMKTLAVFSLYMDKPLEQMVIQLHQYIDEWYIYPLPGDRATSLDVIATKIREVDSDTQVFQYQHLAQALEMVRKRAETHHRIIIFGSFAVAGEAIACLQV